MRQEEAKVIMVSSLPGDLCHMGLQLPGIAREAIPGQFIQIHCTDGGRTGLILPRPFSLFRILPEEERVEIIFRIIGEGTLWLSRRKTGDTFPVLGPLGRGFTLPAKSSRLLFIAGGIGMPPLFSLAERISGSRITLFYGGRSSQDLIFLDKWKELAEEVRLATDDGSAGFSGVITDLIGQTIQPGAAEFYYACGPRPMLKAVKNLMAAVNIPGELSLEERMACGVGACLGCVCRTVRGFQRVCKEGPVFPGEEVIFDD